MYQTDLQELMVQRRIDSFFFANKPLRFAVLFLDSRQVLRCFSITATHFFYPESLSNHPTVLRDDALKSEAISA